MSDTIDQMTGLIGITVAAGVVSKVADSMFPTNRPQSRPVQKKTKKSGSKTNGMNSYERNLHKSVFGH